MVIYVSLYQAKLSLISDLVYRVLQRLMDRYVPVIWNVCNAPHAQLMVNINTRADVRIRTFTLREYAKVTRSPSSTCAV